jgi:hypothetical protein
VLQNRGSLQLSEHKNRIIIIIIIGNKTSCSESEVRTTEREKAGSVATRRQRWNFDPLFTLVLYLSPLLFLDPHSIVAVNHFKHFLCSRKYFFSSSDHLIHIIDVNKTNINHVGMLPLNMFRQSKKIHIRPQTSLVQKPTPKKTTFLFLSHILPNIALHLIRMELRKRSIDPI